MAAHLPGRGTSRVLQRLSPELQGSLLQTMHGMAELITALTGLLQGQAIPAPAAAQRAAEPWRERMQPAPEPSASEEGQVMGRCRSDRLWDELSVVELRSVLRSVPIDRSSLPAPIELLRRRELVQALNQFEQLSL
jgi:hypothetical protein